MRSISNVQVLRGLAATAVLMAHAAGMLLYGDVPVSLPNVEWGAFGVDVFFVISGFVMVYAEGDRFGRLDAVIPFVLRRLARIVPMYWLASLAFASLTAPYGAHAREMRAFVEAVLRAMIFLPAADGSTSMMPTGWTLFYEMGFYLCFACALPFRRRPALVGLSVVLIGLGILGKTGCVSARVGAFATLQLLEFVGGIAIGEAFRAGWRIPRRAGIVLACLTMAYVIVEAPHLDGWTDWRGLAWGLPAAVIVGALVLAPEVRRPSAVRNALERLGDASYSIYIVHFPLFWALGMLMPGVPRSGPHAAQAFVVFQALVGLAVSLVVHRWVEVPATRWLQRVFRQGSRGRLGRYAGNASL